MLSQYCRILDCTLAQAVVAEFDMYDLNLNVEDVTGVYLHLLLIQCQHLGA